eukprot:TRINITY_DN13350_c0_g1_i1.p1 TRINITY_DN13350_c0_g1~~TRINITY_DN13350_c0_g1_i1.p1  ORF type:complete len:179 (-),score=24.98 TRINITY_DN13350_c0_g1_i1:55-591(-)
MTDKNEDVTSVDLYNQTMIKQTLDDTVVRVVTEDRGYPEDHTFTDIKIALGIFITGLALYTHFGLPWPDSKMIVYACVAAYGLAWLLLQALFIFGIGDYFLFTKASTTNPKGGLQARSELAKYDTPYALTLVYRNDNKHQATAKLDVTDYFTVDGDFLKARFTKEVNGLVSALERRNE